MSFVSFKVTPDPDIKHLYKITPIEDSRWHLRISPSLRDFKLVSEPISVQHLVYTSPLGSFISSVGKTLCYKERESLDTLIKNQQIDFELKTCKLSNRNYIICNKFKNLCFTQEEIDELRKYVEECNLKELDYKQSFDYMSNCWNRQEKLCISVLTKDHSFVFPYDCISLKNKSYDSTIIVSMFI